MPYRRHAKKSSSTVTKKKYRTRSSKVVVSQVKRIIKKEISRQAENKTKQYFSNGSNVLPSAATTFLNSIIPVTPYAGFLEIPQGLGQGDRIGNRIMIKNLTMKGTIWPLPYDILYNPNPVPLQVVLWFFINRNTPGSTPTSMNGFLQDGSSSRNLQNQLSDVMARVNGDRYRLLTKRVFKIGYANNAGTGNQPAYQTFANNDFKLNQNFKINLTKYVVKNVRYIDGSNTPSTRGLWVIAQALNADGSSMANNIIPARMSYELNIQYEDF